MSIILKSSKTNVFQEGHQIFIVCSPSLLCTVTAICSYFLAACPWGPLFSFQSGWHHTRSAVVPVHLLRDAACYASLPYKSLKGHSFRIGAASTAAAAGLPGWLIEVLGRWSSDCYQLYIHKPQKCPIVRCIMYGQDSLFLVWQFFCLGDTCPACISGG